MLEIYLFVGGFVLVMIFVGYDMFKKYRNRKQEDKLDQEVYDWIQNYELTDKALADINKLREIGGLPQLTMVEAQLILSFRKGLTIDQLISGKRDRVVSNEHFLGAYMMPLQNDSVDTPLNQLREKFYRD